MEDWIHDERIGGNLRNRCRKQMRAMPIDSFPSERGSYIGRSLALKVYGSSNEGGSPHASCHAIRNNAVQAGLELFGRIRAVSGP